MKGARAKGKTYERKVCRHLERVFGTNLNSGQWIWFFDANGPGYAQPDAFLLMPEVVYLFEIKLTQTISAIYQMKELYEPLLRHIYSRPVVCCQIYKNSRVRVDNSTLIDSPKEILGLPGDRVYNYIYT